MFHSHSLLPRHIETSLWDILGRSHDIETVRPAAKLERLHLWATDRAWCIDPSKNAACHLCRWKDHLCRLIHPIYPVNACFWTSLGHECLFTRTHIEWHLDFGWSVQRMQRRLKQVHFIASLLPKDLSWNTLGASRPSAVCAHRTKHFGGSSQSNKSLLRSMQSKKTDKKTHNNTGTYTI